MIPTGILPVVWVPRIVIRVFGIGWSFILATSIINFPYDFLG